MLRPLEAKEEEISLALLEMGFSLEEVAKIRKSTFEEIQLDIIKAKLQKKPQGDQSLLQALLAMPKEERLAMQGQVDKEVLLQEIRSLYPSRMSIEDRISILWLIAAYRLASLYDLLYREVSSPRVSLRRVAISGIGKIESQEGPAYVLQGLQDENPQVRQYAAKAMMKIGKDHHLKRLKDALGREKKEYVIRALEEAIREIKRREKNV